MKSLIIIIRTGVCEEHKVTATGSFRNIEEITTLRVGSITLYLIIGWMSLGNQPPQLLMNVRRCTNFLSKKNFVSLCCSLRSSEIKARLTVVCWNGEYSWDTCVLVNQPLLTLLLCKYYCKLWLPTAAWNYIHHAILVNNYRQCMMQAFLNN